MILLNLMCEYFYVLKVTRKYEQRVFSFSSLQFTGVIIGIIIVSLMVGIAIGLITGILGTIKCSQKTNYQLNSKVSTNIHNDNVPSSNTKDVVYDELEMNNSSIEMSKNLAYGNIKKQ